MNIFKMNEKERKKAINKLLSDISSEQLLKELIEEGLEIEETIIIEQEYKVRLEYENENYCDIFDIHTKSTSNSFVSRFLKNNANKMEIGDAA